MALSYHIRDILERFDKLKMLEHGLALSLEKNLKIKSESKKNETSPLLLISKDNDSRQKTHKIRFK